MENLIKEINWILSEWDPLSLGIPISLNEYSGYIPTIVKHLNNKEELFKCLENILIYDLETGYNPLNLSHRFEVERIVKKISLIQ
jgi:hypothetical protein